MKKIYKSDSRGKKTIPKSQFIAIFAILLLLSFTVKSFAQTNPATVTCTVVSTTQINASWDVGTGATYYYYEIDQNENFDGSWGPVNGFTTAPTTSTIFTGLTPGATYYVHVAAANNIWVWSGATNSSAYTTCTAIATPSTICSGSLSNLNATSPGNIIKWYDSPFGGTLLNTLNSGVNYSVSPATTTTYYAEPTKPPTFDLNLASTNNYGADGVYYKLTTGANAKTISGFTFKPNSFGVKTISVYYKSGTYAGFESNPGAWTNIGNFSSDGMPGQSFLDIPDITIPAGTTYGFYLYCSSSAFLVKTGNTTTSDASITFIGGSLSYGLFGSTSVYPGYSFTGGVRYLSGYGQVVVARLPVTVTVNQTPSIPTGLNAQSFCNTATVADLQAAGSNIQWYATSSGGSALLNSTNLTSGNHYFAIQTNNGCESLSRLDVVVTINPLPTIALNTMGLIASGSTVAYLSYSATTDNPDKYSIDYDTYANSMGYIDESNISFSGGDIALTIPAGAAATDYNATLTVKNDATGCVSNTYPISLTSIGFSFTVTQNIGTTLLLTWTAIPDANIYNIQYRLISGGNWIGAPAYTNQSKLTNLQPNSEYECRLGIYKNGVFWAYSPLGNFKTADVSYLKIQDIGTNALMSWNSFAPWANNYAFQYRLPGNPTWIGTNSTQNSVKITNLLPDQDYECRIHVYKNGSLWGVCQIGTFHTDKVQFNINQDIGTTAQLGWNSFAPWANNYAFQYRLSGGTTWIGTNSTQNSVKITNLLPDQDYDCRVHVYINGSMWGISQIGTFHTGTVQFSTSQDIGTTLLIDWTAFSGTASSYALQYRPIGSVNWSINPANTNQSKLTNLIPEMDYECKVMVYANNSLWGISQLGTFTTKKVDFNSLTDNGTSMEVEWTSFAQWATSYALQYSLPAMTNWITSANTSNTSITISPLITAQDYFVKLRVYIGGSLWGVSKETLIRRVAPQVKSYSLTENSVDLSTDLSVYPNPFAEQINLEISTAEESTCNWTIYDMVGKIVLTGNMGFAKGNNTMNIDASDLSKGVYMLSTIIGNEKHDFRIVKQ